MNERLQPNDNQPGIIARGIGQLQLAAEVMANQKNRVGAYVGSVLALGVGGTALLETGFPATAASRTTEQGDTTIPDPRAIVQEANQKARDDNPDKDYLGPSDKELEDSLSLAAINSERDPIRKVKFTRDHRRAYRVDLTQLNSRVNVDVASFHDKSDLTYSDVETINESLDADIFARKIVKVTPMIRRGKGRPRKWGKSEILDNWDDFSEDNVARLDSHSIKDPVHKGAVTIYPKHPPRRNQLKSGKFYIDITQKCLLRSREFDKYKDGCARITGTSYRVSPKKTTGYNTSRFTSEKREIPHARKTSHRIKR